MNLNNLRTLYINNSIFNNSYVEAGGALYIEPIIAAQILIENSYFGNLLTSFGLGEHIF